MQVIFTKWHVITLDVVPFLINILLQKKRNYCAMIFTSQTFDTSTLLVISLAFQEGWPCHSVASLSVLMLQQRQMSLLFPSIMSYLQD